MPSKTEEQKIEALTEKIKKLETKKKQLEVKTREKERKARTRRLIQIGAIIESMGINNEDLAKSFKDYFNETPKSKEWLDKFISEHNTKTT